MTTRPPGRGGNGNAGRGPGRSGRSNTRPPAGMWPGTGGSGGGGGGGGKKSSGCFIVAVPVAALMLLTLPLWLPLRRWFR